MRNSISIILGCFFILFLSSSTKTNYPIVKNKAFQSGEYLRYRVTYGWVDAGEAVLEVFETKKKGNNRSLYRTRGVGRTLGAFNSFYKVFDVYESYIDKQSIMPWYFSRKVDEGGYKINQKYIFYQNQKKVNTGKNAFDVPIGIQDMISSFYKARTLDYDNIKKGQVFSFDCFMDDEVFKLKIKYVGDETIKIRKGKFKCHKFVPVVQTGRYFKSEEDVQFWVTSDKNKIPVLIKAKIPVGVVRMHLVEWKGLKNPLSSKVKK